MKKIFTLLVLLSAGGLAPAAADEITVHPHSGVIDTWVGTFVRFDPSSAILFFSCDGAPGNVLEKIHVTRMVSILFKQDGGGYRGGNHSCFPTHAEDVSRPLLGDPQMKGRVMLTNKDGAAAQFKDTFAPAVDAASGFFGFKGRMLSATSDQLILDLFDKSGGERKFTVDKSDMINWIR